jgi:UDP-N-acetyl-D-mannosaminuronate dehydrogenase
MDNVFRDAFFGVTNLFSRLARNHGVSGTEFLENQKAYYPRNQFGIPSLGVGGPCLTKDYYLLKPRILGDAAEYHLSIGRAEHKKALEWILEEIYRHSREFLYVNLVVMGLAFKGVPETQDTRNSPAIELLDILVDRNIGDYAIYYYDTHVKNISCNGATRLDNLDHLVGNTIFVLMNNSEHLTRSGVQEFASKGDFAALIIDSFASFRRNGIIFSGRHVVYKTS